MRKNIKFIVLWLLIGVFLLISLCGCGEEKSGSTIDEPEITGEYLAKEYSEQLITDGASKVIGMVTIEKEAEDSYMVAISEREVVPSSQYDEGYYLADNNIVKEVSFGFDARIACMHDGKLVVEKPDEFIKNHNENNEQLYTVYLMGDSAELILATDPKDILESDK